MALRVKLQHCLPAEPASVTCSYYYIVWLCWIMSQMWSTSQTSSSDRAQVSDNWVAQAAA